MKPKPNFIKLLNQLTEADTRLNYIFNSKLSTFYQTNPVFVHCDQIKPKLGTKQILSSFVLTPYDIENGNTDDIVHQPNRRIFWYF